MNKRTMKELENAQIMQAIQRERAAERLKDMRTKQQAIKEQRRKKDMLKRLYSGMDIVHKGDLLFYDDTLIYCEGKVGNSKWRFSNPWTKDFTLTELEIFKTCSF